METQMTTMAQIACPTCSRCGLATRIYGVEPHMQDDETEVHTFVCDGCETVEVRVIPPMIMN